MRLSANCLGLALMLAILPATTIAADKPASKTYDPNEKICEKVEIIGTRIASKRVCATRAQWEERRRADRDSIDEAQRRVNGPCSSINSHTGAPAC